MPELPIVQTFDIPSLGWQVFDRRTLDGPDMMRAQAKWGEHATALMNRNSSLEPEMLCGRSATKVLSDRERFSEQRKTREELSWRLFQDEGGTVTREWDCDPRLPLLYFCVRDRSGFIGAIPISNIDIESEDRDGIKISGFFLMGVPIAPDPTVAGTWVKVLRFILNETLALDDGRTLDIVQYNLLASDDMRLTMNEDPEIMQFISEMRPHFDVLGDRTNRDAPIRFRRS